jgi:hypothetical protein
MVHDAWNMQKGDFTKTLLIGFKTRYTCENIQDAKTLGWNGKRKMKSYPGR